MVASLTKNRASAQAVMHPSVVNSAKSVSWMLVSVLTEEQSVSRRADATIVILLGQAHGAMSALLWIVNAYTVSPRRKVVNARAV